MVVFCKEADVKDRLRRDLTADERTYLPGMIEEAQLLVTSYLGCGPTPYETDGDVPKAVQVVTSRMVSRVIQEGENADPDLFGATQAGLTAGPYSQQVTYTAGSRTGAPWLTKVDKGILDSYRCTGKAFSVDTVPRQGTVHVEGCSAIDYEGLPGSYWLAYCTCGADMAGSPIYGG